MAADKERGPGSASAEIGKYLEILAKDPNSRVFAPLAEAYRKAGMLDDAIETALEGLKVHPNYLGGRVALGRAYFEKKQLAEAAAEMKKVVAAAPDNLMAHKVLGQIAYAQNDLPSAEKSFKMVLLLDPRDQEAQQFIANIGGGVRPAPAEQPRPAAPIAPPLPPPAPAPETPGGAMAPLSLEEIAIPGLSAPPPVSVDELQPLEELDLAEGGLLDDVAPPAPAIAAAPLPPPIAADLELSEPEPWAAPPPAPEPAAPRVRAVEPAAPDEMQVEVFARVPWGTGQSASPAAPPAEPEAAPGPEEESPFEVFGRPKRGGPPASSKGERLAYQEIEIEQTAHAPVPDEAAPGDEPVFEVFTRTTDAPTPPPPAKQGRGELSGPREIEIETTAFAPYESYEQEPPAPEAGFEIERTAHTVDESAVRESAQEVVLEDELPRIDLAEEMAEDRLDPVAELEPVPEPVVEPVPEPTPEPTPEPRVQFEEPPVEIAPVEVEPSIEVEPPMEIERPIAMEPPFDVEPPTAPELEPGASHPQAYEAPPEDAAEAAPASWGDGLAEVSLDEEIPNIDLTQEVRDESVGEEQVEPVQLPPDRFDAERYAEEPPEEERFDEEAGPAQTEPAPGATRGVFDTETLASIYVSQGFYGRAAEIYRRLISQRPDDDDLRAKLEDVLARERADVEEGEAAPGEAAPAAAAPAATPEDPRIRQLQTLLEAFRGGRSR